MVELVNSQDVSNETSKFLVTKLSSPRRLSRARLQFLAKNGATLKEKENHANMTASPSSL
jgi:hypothetical protein